MLQYEYDCRRHSLVCARSLRETIEKCNEMLFSLLLSLLRPKRHASEGRKAAHLQRQNKTLPVLSRDKRGTGLSASWKVFDWSRHPATKSAPCQLNSVWRWAVFFDRPSPKIGRPLEYRPELLKQVVSILIKESPVCTIVEFDYLSHPAVPIDSKVLGLRRGCFSPWTYLRMRLNIIKVRLTIGTQLEAAGTARQ